MDRAILKRAKSILRLIRYRFFLWAGFFPYFLGQALAYHFKGEIVWLNFFLGLVGLFFVLMGIECFNEYFDTLLGSEFIFSSTKKRASLGLFIFGLFSFVLAFIFCLMLSLKVGRAILIFSLLGFLAAYFYLGPPLRLCSRGLGEMLIGFVYGPLLTLGSFWLQKPALNLEVLFVSFIPALLLFNLALINEIPDYYQDRLSGKNNIVVRIGRKRAIVLYSLIIFFIFSLLLAGLLFKIFSAKIGLFFLLFPLALKTISVAEKHFEYPSKFMPAIRNTIFIYIFISLGLLLNYLLG